MGMTIDEVENYLIALKHCETCEATDTNICKSCPDYRRGSSAKCYDAIDIAIDTMRKYKQIKQILDDWNNAKINTFICCQDIDEVVNDGNDD